MFHKLCSATDESKFLDRTNSVPMIIPSSSSGAKRCKLKCAAANTSDDSSTAPLMGIHFAKDGSRKPRKMASSQMGAQMETTTRYSPLVTCHSAVQKCQLTYPILRDPLSIGGPR